MNKPERIQPVGSSLDRRDFIKTAGAVAGAALIPVAGCTTGKSPQSARSERPNLLFVYADQMREMAMSCSGNSNLSTSNMDALAADGVRFTRMFTSSPLSSPARSSLMTGLYPHNAGVTGNNMHLRDDVPCIAEITRRAGYATGHIGKWHLCGNYSPPSSSEYAFVPPEHHRGFQYWAGFEHGHKYFKGRYFTDSDTPIYIPQGSYEPDVQTDLAVDFIKRNAAVAWHLDLSFGPPHFPIEEVKPQDLARHKPQDIMLRSNVPAKFHAQARVDLCHYYAMIENLDWNVGRLLQTLDSLNLTRNTIVVFTSDHGDMMLSHGQHYKRRPQEESSRVPFLIRYPRYIPGGRTCTGLASCIDIVPTLLDLMGLESPNKTEGLNLAGFLKAKARYPRHSAVFMECPKFGCRDYDPGLYAPLPWRAVRTEKHKAVWLKAKKTMRLVQFFDLSEDPFEMHNLAESSKHSSPAGQLKELLASWIRQTDDRQFTSLL